ncbi:GNAT family N-acetyltransferase [Kitasatospora sp. NPDC056327]|uniref:GNAT family N-acetyltransferase n=1 Tax=Kitasatospora sp. NPDC056327 TaxID=3345785 RepID=UPI0035DB01C5
MSFPLDTPPLEGRLVRLEPLTHAHAAGLAAAAEEERRAYDYTVVPRAEEVTGYIDARLAHAGAGLLAPYAQVDRATGRAVGVTSFLDPRPWPSGTGLYAVEIGGTWLAASAQGTGVNSEAKYLLFRHAFEHWNVVRVDLRTDARNERSRAALAAVGATFEGVLRNWSPSWAPGEDGRLRDSAMFSVTPQEWPATKEHLERRIAQKWARSRAVLSEA